MKKQVKKIVFVGIIVVLLLLGWFILEQIIPDDESKGTIKILDLDPVDYSMVGIVEPGQTYKYFIGKLEPGEDAEEGAEPQYYFWDDGQFDQPIADSAYRAARDALNGADPSGGAIYYFNPVTATSKWIWSRPHLLTIGKHRFCS